MDATKINPSWMIQGLIGVLLAIIGVLLNNQLETINSGLATQGTNITALQKDLAELEIGLRGDRFTQSDWVREERILDKKLDDIEKRLREVEKR